jgi:hypothetical protein
MPRVTKAELRKAVDDMVEREWARLRDPEIVKLYEHVLDLSKAKYSMRMAVPMRAHLDATLPLFKSSKSPDRDLCIESIMIIQAVGLPSR